METLDELGFGIRELVSIGGWLIAVIASFLLLLLLITPIIYQNGRVTGWDLAMKRAHKHKMKLSEAIRTKSRIDIRANDRVLVDAVCPACAVIVPQSRLSLLLIHLYKDHSWTRERIADWLEQSGFDNERETR